MISTKLRNDVWIGARVIILLGITIGGECIIAAWSVVMKSCAPNGLVYMVVFQQERLKA